MKRFIVVTIVTLYSLLMPAQKQAIVVSDKPGWHKIAETTADFEKESDEVDVLLADKFAALQFKVTDAPLELLDIDVYFKDGEKQTIKVGYAIKKPGETSKEIDLHGPGERRLYKIVFRYRTLQNRHDKKSHVEIWGRKE